MVVRDAYLRAILLLLVEFEVESVLVLLLVGLKEVKTSDVGILLGLERL